MLTPVEFETLHYEALTREPEPTKYRQRTWADSIFFGMLSILSDSNSSGIKPGPIHQSLVRQTPA